jgi:hypothetical protein
LLKLANDLPITEAPNKIKLTIEAQNYIDLPRKWLNVSDKELNFNTLFVA